MVFIALHDNLNQTTTLVEDIVSWCAFNDVDCTKLISDSLRNVLHFGRWQVYSL